MWQARCARDGEPGVQIMFDWMNCASWMSASDDDRNGGLYKPGRSIFCYPVLLLQALARSPSTLTLLFSLTLIRNCGRETIDGFHGEDQFLAHAVADRSGGHPGPQMQMQEQHPQAHQGGG